MPITLGFADRFKVELEHRGRRDVEGLDRPPPGVVTENNRRTAVFDGYAFVPILVRIRFGHVNIEVQASQPPPFGSQTDQTKVALSVPPLPSATDTVTSNDARRRRCASNLSRACIERQSGRQSRRTERQRVANVRIRRSDRQTDAGIELRRLTARIDYRWRLIGVALTRDSERC